MIIGILMISILTSKWITAVLLEYMIAHEIDAGLDTIEELGEAGIPVYTSDEMKMTMDQWKANIE